MNSARKRIVFDTSSLIPVCLHPDREPARLFRQVILNHQVFASPETLKELLAVLSRDKFDAWQPLNQRLGWAKCYMDVVTLVEPNETISDCRDEKDNKFLELAQAAKADILISSDTHLLELHPYRNIEILRIDSFREKYLPMMQAGVGKTKG